MKTLPPTYYLDHFYEFLGYLEGPCAHLLNAADKDFIEGFKVLSHDAQLVLVRIYNRQSVHVRRDSLHYEEIDNPRAGLDELFAAGLVSDVSEPGFGRLLEQLNKAELQSLLAESPSKTPAKSAKKALWFEFAQAHALFSDSEEWLNEHYLEQQHEQRLAYFLFLYFGNVRARLNQLSMRDLGVMRTRQLSHEAQARFSTADEARGQFYYRWLGLSLKNTLDQALDEFIAMLEDYPATIKSIASVLDTRDRFYWQLAKRLLQSPLEQHDDHYSIQILKHSRAADAVEKRLRLEYQQGRKEQVKSELEAIIDDPDSETLYVFAVDFYQRKFHRKRTSILTDMLRDSNAPIPLDEAYVSHVEQGVCAYYERQGITALRSENVLWRALFGLTFWPELYQNPKAGVSNEFDWLPRLLKQNTFYAELEHEIEARLAQLQTPQQWLAHLLQVSTRYYGQVNGVFSWHQSLLELIKPLLTKAPVAQTQAVLRAMAYDYHQLSDGFADLMVLDEQGLRFEEIKAPGDSLRRNQLITLQCLKKAGFEIAVRRVEWMYNPDQAYVVVDVETTGGNHSSHRVTEVGMVKVINGQVVDRWQSLVNPQRYIPARITELTGISNEMVADAPVFEAVAEAIDDFWQDAIFVAHNVNFDYGFLKREMERAGRRLNLPKLCTVRMARKQFPGLASYSLGRLCEQLGIELVRHHRALDDACAAAGILRLVQQSQLQQNLIQQARS